METLDGIELTEEEEELTHYCVDFCPIYEGIENFNRARFDYNNRIWCNPEWCDKLTKAFILDERARKKSMQQKATEIKE